MKALSPLCVEIMPSLQPHGHRRTCFTARQWQRASLAGDLPSFKAGKFPRTASSHQDHQPQDVHETPKWDSQHRSQTDSPQSSELKKPLHWQKPLPFSLFIFNCCIDSRAGDSYSQETEPWSLLPLSTAMIQENSFTPLVFSNYWNL